MVIGFMQTPSPWVEKLSEAPLGEEAIPNGKNGMLIPLCEILFPQNLGSPGCPLRPGHES
jgi:hypothetical protein